MQWTGDEPAPVRGRSAGSMASEEMVSTISGASAGRNASMHAVFGKVNRLACNLRDRRQGWILPVTNTCLTTMQMRVGYELIYDLPQQTPMALMLNIHHSRAGDIVVPDRMIPEPFVPMTTYADSFGNWCTRIVAPPGRLRLSASAVINDSGQPDPIALWEPQHAVEDLPDESLVFLLGSRYCETDRLSGIAWDLFGSTPPGGQRVQAICDYVHRHITLQLPGRETDENGVGGSPGGQRRVPRLRASGDRVLPLHEHSGSLLHGLPQRHRHPAAATARWISPPGSRPISAGAGTRSIRGTTCR